MWVKISVSWPVDITKINVNISKMIKVGYQVVTNGLDDGHQTHVLKWSSVVWPNGLMYF